MPIRTQNTVKKLLFWWCALLILCLSACPQDNADTQQSSDQESAQTTQSEQKPLRLGFVPSESTAEIQRHAQPLVDQLGKDLGREVVAVMATDYTGLVEAFRNGSLDAAFLTPASYVMAAQEAGVKVILRTQRGEIPFYYSVIFARKDSNIKSLKDLKGKSVAFGDNLSTAGYIFPLKMFKAAGIDPQTDFENVLFSGGHDATVLAVYNKKVAAGATYANDKEGKDAAWQHVLKPEQIKEIEVIQVSEPIPSDNICVSKELPADTVKKIQDFFLQMHTTEEGKKRLYDLYRIEKFVTASDADYQGIREAFELSGIHLKEEKKKTP
jgi:phosphonate transport system substrate-binding protein